MKRLALDRETLRALIEDQRLQQDKIAEQLGCSRDSVMRYAKRYGLATQRTGPRSGAGHPNWKGGRKAVKGYVYIYRPDHPNATKAGYVSEHRLAMEAHLGRTLHPDEVVHHKNEDTQDNRIENLGLFSSNTAHLRETLKGQQPRWTQEGVERIASGIQKSAIVRKRSGRYAVPRTQTIARLQAKLESTPREPSE